MKAGIIQSAYVPWRGYFDFIASVDVFILLDDIAFGSKGNWRHRNQLKFAEGLRWLTVPVKSRVDMPIDEVVIDASTGWHDRHRGLLRESLGRAPRFKDAEALWEGALAAHDGRLSSLNAAFIRAVCAYLGIATRIVDARALAARGAKTERLIDLLAKVGADSYLSGPVAREYIEPRLFEESGIALEYKAYDYPPYPQQHGAFAGTVSVLDLIANAGPAARGLIASRPARELAPA